MITHELLVKRGYTDITFHSAEHDDHIQYCLLAGQCAMRHYVHLCW